MRVVPSMCLPTVVLCAYKLALFLPCMVCMGWGSHCDCRALLDAGARVLGSWSRPATKRQSLACPDCQPTGPPALSCPAPPVLQLEQAAKQESQRIQSLLEDGSDPDVKDVQASRRRCC